LTDMRNQKNNNMKDVRRYFLGIPLFLFLVAVGPARSDDIASVKAMMWDGDFYEAAEIAAKLGGLEGFTLAAAALAIHGYEIAPESEKQEHFLRAIDYAEKAIEIDPNNSEANLQISHTLGRYAQTVGVAEALSGGFAERTKAAMDRAVELDPENVRAHLSFGSWHAEIVAAAGFMAKLLYGANEEDALLAYQRALDLEPDSSTVHFEYAVGLMRLDDENLELARIHLKKAISLPLNNAYDKIVREKATRDLMALPEK